MPGMGDLKFYENKRSKSGKGGRGGASYINPGGGPIDYALPYWDPAWGSPYAPAMPGWNAVANPAFRMPTFVGARGLGVAGAQGLVPATPTVPTYNSAGGFAYEPRYSPDESAPPITPGANNLYKDLLRNYTYVYDEKTGKYYFKQRDASNSFGGTDMGLTTDQLEKMMKNQDPGALNKYGQPIGTAAPGYASSKKGHRNLPGSKTTGSGSQGGSFFGTVGKSRPRYPDRIPGNGNEDNAGLSSPRLNQGAVWRP